MIDAWRTAMLDGRVLSMNLRSYQQAALDILTAGVQAGKRRFHIVAPPGSGKTIIGIALMQTLRIRTAILSPNSAIQAQWMDKYGKATADIVDVANELWGNDISSLISHDPAHNTPILSLTYQRLAVRDDNGEMHANVHDLIALLRNEGFGLLILDECHHLVAFWAETIREVLESHDMLVLGLTATPPFDRGNREQATYLDLVGAVDYSIPLPAVVKDGNLAPWQDLVYLVHPDEHERGFIGARHDTFHALVRKLNSSDSLRPTLNMHVQSIFDAPRYRNRSFDSFAHFLRERSSAALAYARYAFNHGIPLPRFVNHLDEMEEAPTLDDIVCLLQGYIDDAFEHEHGSEDEAFREEICSALQQLGYDIRDGVFVKRSSSIDRILAVSSSKLPAMCTILAQEQRNLGDALRVLVLTDFETAQAGSRRAEHGVLDPDAGGAAAVMRTLTSRSETDALDPVMLTGSTVLVDDDLASRFLRELRAIVHREQWDIQLEAHHIAHSGQRDTPRCPEQAAEQTDSLEGMYRIEGRGKDWNTRCYVLMITELFDRGVTRCLVGTRGLLGEGWDSASVNVLIDLTAVASYVSVNQMHGRSLRLHEAQPAKVANNWDIVAVLPEYERGFSDWERFLRKHEHLYGLSDDGELERGVGHVHPMLTHVAQSELTAALPVVNADMLRRSAMRAEALRAWRVGASWEGLELPCFEFHADAATPRSVVHTGRSAQLLERRISEFHLQRKNGRIVILAFLLVATVLCLAAPPLSGIAPALQAAIAALATVLIGSAIQRYRLSRYRGEHESIDIDSQIASYAEVIRDTMTELREGAAEEKIELHSSRRQDGSLRIWITSPIEGENDIFQRALGELFHPLQDQRYILRLLQPPSGKRVSELLAREHIRDTFEAIGVAPLPSDFGRKREHAEVFHRNWERLIGPADLYYTRRGKGATLLEEQLRRRLLAGKRFNKRIWI
jgi:superfamily II DNA or RNA helicase